MEALRDLALAVYENKEDEFKIKLQDQFKKMVEDGSDFSEYFKNRTIPAPIVPDMMAVWQSGREIYRKKRLDFEEFITLMYIDENPKAVIVCKGCSSLITGKPYFIYNGGSFDLCCDCYRSRNFKGHKHTSFLANHLLQHRIKGQLAGLQDGEERRYEVDGAIIEFSKDFIKFARSIATDDEWENRFGELLNERDNKREEISHRMKLPQKEKKKSKARGSRNVDLLGMESTGVGN